MSAAGGSPRLSERTVCREQTSSDDHWRLNETRQEVSDTDNIVKAMGNNHNSLTKDRETQGAIKGKLKRWQESGVNQAELTSRETRRAGKQAAIAGRVKGRIKHRFNPRDMKHRVNPTKSGRELEPDRHWINHLGDSVWPNESGRQLTRRRPERQILGRKPYPLNAHIGWRRRPATIGCCFGSSWGSNPNPPDSLPGAAAALNESQGRWDRSIGFLWWKQRWFITHRALKRGHIPEAATGRELRAYSIHESCWHHELGLLDVRQWRILSRSWLARSHWPLVCGWKPEDRLAEAPIHLQNSFQSREAN